MTTTILCKTRADDHRAYAEAVVEQAIADLGVREVRVNDGSEIDAWQEQMGIDDEAPYCAAALWDWHHDAAEAMGGVTTLPKAGNACGQWALTQKRGGLVYLPEHVLAGIIKPRPGDTFHRVKIGRASDVARVRDQNRAYNRRTVSGHCGLVIDWDGEWVLTIEANTNADPDVFERDESGGDGPGTLTVHRKRISLELPELVGFTRPTLVPA